MQINVINYICFLKKEMFIADTGFKVQYSQKKQCDALIP